MRSGHGSDILKAHSTRTHLVGVGVKVADIARSVGIAVGKRTDIYVRVYIQQPLREIDKAGDKLLNYRHGLRDTPRVFLPAVSSTYKVLLIRTTKRELRTRDHARCLAYIPFITSYRLRKSFNSFKSLADLPSITNTSMCIRNYTSTIFLPLYSPRERIKHMHIIYVYFI